MRKPRFLVFFVAALLALAGTARAQSSAAMPEPAADQSPLGADNRALAYYHFALSHLYEDLAGVHNRSDYLSRAIEELRKAVEYDPQNPMLSAELAELYARSGRIRDAISEAQEILKKDPANLQARRLLGRIYVRTLGDLQAPAASRETLGRAIEQYEEIVRLDPRDTDSMLMLARLYRFGNDTTRAEATLKRILAVEPESEQALSSLAMLYSDLGQYQQAISLLEKVTGKNPNPQLLGMLARAYEEAHDYANAAAIYRRALETDKENTDLRRGLAQSLLAADKLEEALAEYRAVIEVEPEDAGSYLRISQIYRAQRKYDLAQTNLAKARTLDPENLEIPFNEALLAEAQGKFQEAIRLMGELVASTARPNDNYTPAEQRNRALFLERLGDLYRQVENYAAAIETFQKMLALDEDSRRASVWIIETYRMARQLDRAIQEAEAALKKSPDDRSLQMVVAGLLGDRGDTEAAVQRLRALLKKTAEDREVYLSLAQVYERGKRYREAEEAVHQAEKLSQKPQEMEPCLFLLGAIYERQKRYDQAEEQFKRVLAINPKNAGTLNYLGYMLADRGARLPESVELIKRALEIDPHNGAYLDSLGWAYFKMNQLDLAEEYLRKAAERISRDPTILDHLGELYARTGRMDLAENSWDRALAEWANAVRTDYDSEEVSKIQKKLETLKHRLAEKVKQ